MPDGRYSWLHEIRRLAVGAILLTIVHSAVAAIRGETYEKLMNDPERREMIRAYVLGVGTAFELVNTDMRASGKGVPLYCPPEGTTMTNQRYTEILDVRLNQVAEMKEERRLAADFIPLVEPELLRGLQATFPCR